MAFWSNRKWKENLKNLSIIEPADSSNIEEAGYALRVGSQIYTNSLATSIPKKLGVGGDDYATISPGEFAYILTKEIITIPKNCIGFISVRATIKFKGLVNVSGFQVNPGWHGRLLFAVFNAGPNYIKIKYNDKMFSLWLADLDQNIDSFDEAKNIPSDMREIPSDILNQISGEALTAYQLKEQIDKIGEKQKKLSDDLEDIKNKMTKYLIIGGAIAAYMALPIIKYLLNI